MKRAHLNPEYGKRHVVLNVRDGAERHYDVDAIDVTIRLTNCLRKLHYFHTRPYFLAAIHKPYANLPVAEHHVSYWLL